jgi:hypothetical protein
VSELREVQLLGLPVPLQAAATEHFDELAREFDHLAAGQEGPHQDVPERLLALQAALSERFSGFTQLQQDELADAVERGEESIDLRYRVPQEAGLASAALAVMLDEADDYCAQGDFLLTLKTPPGPLAYRRWLLGQFTDQLSGSPPVSWPEWAARHAPELLTR